MKKGRKSGSWICALSLWPDQRGADRAEWVKIGSMTRLGEHKGSVRRGLSDGWLSMLNSEDWEVCGLSLLDFFDCQADRYVWIRPIVLF
jgi:hypothetical protein